MTDLRFYFDGTNGTPVNGEVLLDVMISKEEKPKDIGQLKFRYSDSFFLHSACSYDHELAIMSLGLTMSAFTYKADGDKHARKALNSIGCDDRTIESFRFDDQQSCADSCGYIIAAKKLPDDTFLIPVVIRSHCYGGEWVSNAHAVEEAYPDHAVGFKAAADGVYDAVTDYITRRGFDRGRVKLWLCGYSRGGAVTNLLGARFTFESGIGKDNIFAYSFATPVTVFDRACLFTDNIFNIMSEMDIVPRMPLRYWALTRYGADMIVPCKARRGLGEYTRLLGQMQAQFAGIMGELGVEAAYVPLDDQERALDLLFDYIDDLLDTPEKYRDDGYQQLAMDYMRSKMHGDTFELRKFLNFLLDGNEEMADELCEIVMKEIEEIAANGPRSEDIEKTREFMLKSWKNSLEMNSGWMNYIQAKYGSGLDYVGQYEQAVRNLTNADVQALAKKLLADGNLVKVIMRPAKEKEK